MNKYVMFMMILGVLFAENVQATSIAESGSCGNLCTYTIDAEGNLIMSGPTAEDQAGVGGGWGQFKNREDIKSIEITGNFSTITSSVFAGMQNVESIKIGDGVQKIGGYAFDGNSAKTVIIGKVESVDYVAFRLMPNLETVTFKDGNNPTLSSYVFTGSGGESGVTVVLPEGLTTIPAYALGGLQNSNIIIPDSLQSIGYTIYATGSNYTTYCHDTPERPCSNMFKGTGKNQLPYTPYFKEDGMYLLRDGEHTAYFSDAVNMAKGNECPDTNTLEGLNACKAQALQNLGKCKNFKECSDIVYQASAGEFFANGQFYASLNDLIANKRVKKLIYTVEEAEAVTAHGDKFRVFLKYK